MLTLLERFDKKDGGDEALEAFEKKDRGLKPFAKHGDIKWNFGKFLIDGKGNPMVRFSSALEPGRLTEEIEKSQ